jgi:hypothetical protein
MPRQLKCRLEVRCFPAKLKSNCALTVRYHHAVLVSGYLHYITKLFKNLIRHRLSESFTKANALYSWLLQRPLNHSTVLSACLLWTLQICLHRPTCNLDFGKSSRENKTDLFFVSAKCDNDRLENSDLEL